MISTMCTENASEPTTNQWSYCQIYLYTDQDISSVSRCIASLDASSKLEGYPGGYSIHSEIASLDIEKNEDFDQQQTAGVDGFLYFPYKISIECHCGSAREAYIAWIGNILKSFWNQGMFAVAACDFEDDLPMKGGYKTSFL